MSQILDMQGQEVAKFDWPEQVNGHIIRLEREVETLTKCLEAFEALVNTQSLKIKQLEKRRWWFI